MAENLINITDINNWSDISVNYDQNKLNNFIKVVQDIKIKKLLGNDLYQAIFDDSESYEELIEKIKPVLVFWTMDKLYREGGLFFTPTGAVLKDSDYTVRELAPEQKMQLEGNCETARFYENELYDYLVELADPLWNENEKANEPCGNISIRCVDGLNSLITDNTEC